MDPEHNALPGAGGEPGQPLVLIVDDSPENLAVLGAILEPFYRVRVVNGGRRALDIVADAPRPDLVLLDVMMPDIDGYAVLERMRANPDTRDIPVMFVTAMDATESEQRGFDLGAVDYLVKPLRPPVVLARVRAQLELKFTADRLRRHNAELEAEITRRVEAEREVRALNAVLDRHGHELERINRELEAFSYTVSHDLRAPLRAINGFAHLIEESEAAHLSPDGRQLFGRLLANTRRMGELIDGVLDYSRQSRAQLQHTRVDVAALVGEVVAELAATYPAARIEVAPLPPVEADATMLRQVFSNLIGNALKFSGRRPAPLVEVGVREADGAREYFVRDNGAGFDPQYASKLFGMFQRLHREADFPGHGVGLAIVKRLVERHGGQIRAEAAPDQGACFYFTLG